MNETQQLFGKCWPNVGKMLECTTVVDYRLVLRWSNIYVPTQLIANACQHLPTICQCWSNKVCYLGYMQLHAFCCLQNAKKIFLILKFSQYFVFNLLVFKFSQLISCFSVLITRVSTEQSVNYFFLSFHFFFLFFFSFVIGFCMSA